jgi:bla regulator protein blaR1
MMPLLLESAVRSLVLGVAVWVGLGLLRVRSPAAKSLVWTVVLIASLGMPLLVESVREASPSWAAVSLPYNPGPLLQVAEPSAIPIASAPVSLPAPGWSFGWLDIVSAAYVLVAATLLLRLLTGTALTWRLMRAGEPLAGDAGIRISPAITVPVTFAGRILLPADASCWSPAKREAVLAHERAHIARGDFHIHLLAKLNRAVFWFNPFAWWLDSQLAELAEAASDDIAVEQVGLPLSYAEILLDVANRAGRVPTGVAMARSGAVGDRIERIIAGITFPRIGGRAAGAIILGLLPLVMAAAITVAAPADDQSTKQVAIDPKVIDRYVGAYEFDPAKAPNQVLDITRDGDRLFVDSGSTPKIELFPKSDSVFFEKGTDTEIAFTGSKAGPAPSLFLAIDGHKPGFEAKRVDQEEALRVKALIEQKRQEAAKPHTAIAADPATFDAYAGKYKFANFLFTVTHEGDYLFVQVAGQGKLRAVPEGAHDFFFKEIDAQVSFVASGNDKASQLILHQNGRDMIAPRVDDTDFKAAEADLTKRLAEQARPRTAVAIDPKLLDGYTGRFQAAPGNVFVVTREGNSLFVKFKDQPSIPVYPEDDHNFFYTVVPAQITFIVGDNGRAGELVLHQGGRDIPAPRIE